MRISILASIRVTVVLGLLSDTPRAECSWCEARDTPCAVLPAAEQHTVVNLYMGGGGNGIYLHIFREHNLRY